MVRTKQAVKPSLTDEGKEDGEGEVGSTTPDAQIEEDKVPAANGVESTENEAPDSTADSSQESKPSENDADAPTEAPKKSSKKGKSAPAKKEEPAAEEDKKKKIKKKVIPAWATLSDTARERLAKSTKMKVSRGKLEDEVVEAVKAVANERGIATVNSIRKYLTAKLPDMPKFQLKKAVMKALEKKMIKQTAGKGFSGSFKIETSSKKGAKSAEKVSMEELFPNVFTWQCNPKEASITLIRRYIAKHYPDLDVDGLAFKKAIENGEKKGQLKRITAKGNSGTFALVDGANKTGGKYEDAIENAIIAMNEPKDVSIPLLRDYFGHYHKEYNTDNRPHLLKNAIERAEDKEWIVRVTGKGFSGSFRLNWPYHPSPREIWGDEYVEPAEATKSNRKRAAADSDDESEEEFSDEEEEEFVPKAKKRGAPKARGAPAPPRAKMAKKTTKPAAKKTKPAPKRKARK